MANHPSAIKRNRQTQKRTKRNQGIRSNVRSIVKKARIALESGDKAAAESAVKAAGRTLSKAASKGVLHRKNASRRLARLARQASALA
jgi:small subunit ribosomal protein S20